MKNSLELIGLYSLKNGNFKVFYNSFSASISDKLNLYHYNFVEKPRKFIVVKLSRNLN